MSLFACTSAIELLVIEDDPADAALLAAHLDRIRHATFRLHRASTLAAAKEAMGARRFDLALVDLSLPDASGLEILRVLGTAPGSPPLIVLTGCVREDLAFRCIEAGAQDHLDKDDITPATLWRSVSFALLRAQRRSLARQSA